MVRGAYAIPHLRQLTISALFVVTLTTCVSVGELPSADSASRATKPSPQELSMTSVAQPLDAEDIGRRMLKLIDSIRSAHDITPEHIQQTTGLKVDIWSADQSKYGLSGKVTDAWYYGLRSMPPAAPGAKPNSLLFSFSDQSGGDADPTPICGLTFQDYSHALSKAGFTAKPIECIRGVDSWRFTRGDVSVSAYVFGDGDPAAPGACVSQLIINARA